MKKKTIQNNLKFLSICLMLSVNQAAASRQAVSLNGTWQIVFDHYNEGREKQWFHDEYFPESLQKEIRVPSCWEEIEKDYEGVAFYRREFEVPADWSGKVIRLQFDAVNYLTEVWINDEVVGYHEGGFTPFEFHVEKMIRPGEANVLTLRVVGPIFLSGKEVDGVKALETPQWRGGITGGIWQSVRMVATGDVYVDDVFIESRIGNNTVILNIELANSAIKGAAADIQINIIEDGRPAGNGATVHDSWDLHPGKNKNRWVLTIPEAQTWSPDNPFLYRAELSVACNGVISDRWSQRFGMREFTIKNKDFYLNGKPVYVKAAFFEGLYPNRIAYPDNEAMARKEIRLAKEAGFNMIRPWRHPPAPMWLDLADEMGVLVVGSPALECMQLPLSTPYLPSRVENEIRQAVLRDRNRACIVQWELFNELHRPVLKQLMRPMAMLVRSLDPTRLILDESGGWAFGANMYLPGAYEPSKFNDIHTYPGPFINRHLYDGFLAIGLTDEERKQKGLWGKSPGRNVVPGLMSFVSELGYGSLPDLVTNNRRFLEQGNALIPAFRYHRRLDEGQRRVLTESGFSDLYPDMKQFYLDQQAIHGSANKRMIEAVRSNPEVDGYCIHALVAGDWIMGAGLLDLWRNPKSFAYEGTRLANQPRILTIEMHPRNVYAARGTEFRITGVNELEGIKGILKIEIVTDDGRPIWKQTKNVDMDSGITPLFRDKLETEILQGHYTLRVQLSADNGSVLAGNAYGFDVFSQEQLTITKKPVAVIDAGESFKNFLKASGIEFEEFYAGTDPATPVFVLQSDEQAKQSRFDLLEKFINSGGTVVYLNGPGESSLSLPFTAKIHPARGLWTCIPHLVHDHSVFEGLPVNGMMRDVFENVWSVNTLRDLSINGGTDYETVVASIGFDWFSSEHKMHYSGPGDAWWGADLAIVSLGKGRCVISQLRLLENLGQDPVADKILFNLIDFVTEDKAK